MSDVPTRKLAAVTWFKDLRDQICAVFQQIEAQLEGTEHANLPPGKFVQTPWQRGEGKDGGGGEMSLMHGRVFEKVGVNISTVHGVFSEEFRKQIPGTTDTGEFWASGISLVAHMRSPLVPAVHFNTRHIVTSKAWFGGGTDLTPMFFDRPETEIDKKLFHEALRVSCDAHDKAYYPKFSKWCDEYFYLKHRNEPRGVGGIFFDYLEDNWENDFHFTKDVGRTFLDIFPQIVRSRMHAPWTPQEREHQLIRRGRYVEFNLLYDRGTMFGLKTGGHTDAILMSLPPHAKWP